MKLNKRSGISLIVLVITIIVMIILAAAIILSLSGNGILGKANAATQAQKASTLKEAISFYEAEVMLAENGGGSARTVDEFIQDIKEDDIITSEEASKLNNGETIEIDGVEYNKDTFVIIKEKNSNATLAQKVSVGDYVNYTYTPSTYTTPAASTGKAASATQQTFNSSETAAITEWRVLSVENGVIKLFPVIPDDDTKLIISGTIDGYKNGSDVLNEMCKKLYSGDYGTARSVKIEDINQATGYKENKWYYIGVDGNKVTIDGDVKTISEIENNVELPELDKTKVVGANKLQDLKITAYTYTFRDFGFTNETATPETYVKKDPVWTQLTKKQPFWIASTCVHPDYDETDLTAWTPRVQYSQRFFSSGSISVRYMTDSTGQTASDREYLVAPIVILKAGFNAQDVGDKTETYFGENFSYNVWEIT